MFFHRNKYQPNAPTTRLTTEEREELRCYNTLIHSFLMIDNGFYFPYEAYKFIIEKLKDLTSRDGFNEVLNELIYYCRILRTHRVFTYLMRYVLTQFPEITDDELKERYRFNILERISEEDFVELYNQTVDDFLAIQNRESLLNNLRNDGDDIHCNGVEVVYQVYKYFEGY